MAVWRLKRNLENSILKYITDNVGSDWTGVSIGFSFDYKESTLPFIAIRLDSATHKKAELGNTVLETKSLIIIDIYAKGDGQRGDLAQYLLDKLKDGFVYYEYAPNPADKDNPLTTANGWIYCDIVGDLKVDLGVDADEKDKCRHRITIQLLRNKI